MLHVTVDALTPCKRLPYRLFDRAGQLLFERGATLLPIHLRMLRQCGIAEVVAQDTLDGDPVEKAFDWHPVDPGALAPGHVLAGDLFDETGCRLAPAGATVTAELLQRLKQLNPAALYAAIPADTGAHARLMRFRHMAAPEPSPETPLEVALSRAARDIRPATRRELLQHRAGPSRRAPPKRVEPDGRPALDFVDFARSADVRDAQRRQPAVRSFEGLARGVERFFDALRSDTAHDGVFAQKLVRRAFALLAADPPLTLALALQRDGPMRDYLPRHALNGCLLAMGMGAVMKFGIAQTIELGSGALLHDVGMLKLPRRLTDKPAPLSAADRQHLAQHPRLSLETLLRFHHVPASVPFVAWQAHERADASGYPLGRAPAETHTFAQIAALADVFDALIAERPWRTGHTPHQAMVETLRMVRAGKLSNLAAKGLVDLLGLYPVGSVVELTDGAIARVVSCGPGDPERPLVSALLRGNHQVIPPERIDLRHAHPLSIAREHAEMARSLHRFAGF